MWIPIILILAVVIIFYVAAGTVNASIAAGVGNIYKEIHAVEMTESHRKDEK